VAQAVGIENEDIFVGANAGVSTVEKKRIDVRWVGRRQALWLVTKVKDGSAALASDGKTKVVHLSGFDLLDTTEDDVWSDEIQCSALVVGTPTPPV